MHIHSHLSFLTLFFPQLNEEREKVKVSNSEIKVLKNEIEKMIKEKEDEKSFRVKVNYLKGTNFCGSQF